MAHAFVHAPDDDHRGGVGGQRDVGERRQPEREGDRHAEQHARRRRRNDEEDEQIPVAERSAASRTRRYSTAAMRQSTSATPTRSATPRRARRSRPSAIINAAPIGSAAARARCSATPSAGVCTNTRPGRTRRHRSDQDHQEGKAAAIATASARLSPAGSHRRQCAVMRMCSPRRNATAAPSIGQPEEQDRGQFVGPDERAVEDVAHDHAHQQHETSADHQQRGRDFDRRGRALLSSQRWLRRVSDRVRRYVLSSCRSSCMARLTAQVSNGFARLQQLAGTSSPNSQARPYFGFHSL